MKYPYRLKIDGCTIVRLKTEEQLRKWMELYPNAVLLDSNNAS